MIKENIKPIILGLSFIIGVIIYTEQTKYVLVDSKTDWGGVNYYLLNRTNGEVFHYSNYETMNKVVRIEKNGQTTYNEIMITDLTKEE